MRILGIETSTRRGSVALVENGNLVISAEYEELHAHAERILPRIATLMDEAGWSRASLDRIAVGIGPGSFTGLRVGIALGQGIAMGVSAPLVGITSLAAMAYAVPPDTVGVRCPLLDARRNEIYVGAYAPDGSVVRAPTVLSRAAVRELVAGLVAAGPTLALGEAAVGLGLGCESMDTAATALPHALPVALLGERLDPETSPATPTYVREADAVLPKLPQSPLERPRQLH